MKFVGVDGYRKGWVCVWIDSTGHRGFKHIRNLADLSAFGPARVMIDIPIGLPDAGDRECDRQAQRMLKQARSRVFLGVRRGLLQHIDSYSAANAWAKKNGKGVSRQMFHILPKIKQADDFITAARQRTMREMHPELVFLRLNGFLGLPSKKTAAGLGRRRYLLARNGFAQLGRWRRALRGSGVKEDDLLDACAGALAALKPARLPGKTARDARGLRMEICC